eukprot:gene32558-40171_t
MQVLHTSVTERMTSAKPGRDAGVTAREELVIAIDFALGQIPTIDVQSTTAVSDVQSLLEPLLAALREGGFSQFGTNGAVGESSKQNADGEGDQGADSPTSSDLIEPADIDNSLDQKVIDSVLNNENLSSEQKQDILGSAETDMKMMESIIELERKRQEDAIRHALETSAVDTQAEDISQSAKFAEEAQILKDSLEAERAAQLNEILAAEEGDSLQDKRLVTLANTRLAAVMRNYSSHARLSYKELTASAQFKRLKVQLAVFEPGSSKTKITAEVRESRLYNLDIEESKDLDVLSTKLTSELTAVEKSANKIRDLWMADSSAVNLNAEVTKLKSESNSQFSSLRTRVSHLSDSLRENNQLACELKLATLKARSKGVQDKTYLDVLAASEEEKTASNNTVEALSADDLRVLEAEETQLQDMLNHATSWSGKVDERAQQSHLHLRILGGLHVNSSIHNRLAMVEFELKSEVDKVKVSNDLRKSNADRVATDKALTEFNTKKTSDLATKIADLTQKLHKIHETEQKRQESAPVNFEREPDIAHSLEEKKKALLESMRADVVSEETKDIAIRQIDAESLREDLELRSAYDSFETDYTVRSLTFREFEERRLRELGRPPEELTKLYADIKEHE